jgi:hypothetical protein
MATRLEVVDPDRGDLGAAQRAGEAYQQQSAVAQSHQVVTDRGEDLPQDLRCGGEFLGRQVALVGGGAVDTRHGLGDMGLDGGHRAAGDEVQITDGGAAQVDGGDAGAAAVLGGEERHHVGGAGRQAGHGMGVAPGAPGAHAGAAGGADGAVMLRDNGRGGGVEPGAHRFGRLVTWRRG